MVSDISNLFRGHCQTKLKYHHYNLCLVLFKYVANILTVCKMALYYLKFIANEAFGCIEKRVNLGNEK